MNTSATINPDTIITQGEGLVSSQIDGEIVMMSVNNEQYYGLDAVGSRIWELIAQPRSVFEVCETLLSEFQVDRDTCQRDVLKFVEHLYAEKIIRIVAPAPA
jgi:Coenzyme PQQ synthesis protein D (PqqD)